MTVKSSFYYIASTLTFILIISFSYKNRPYEIDPKIKSKVESNSKTIVQSDTTVKLPYYYNRRMGSLLQNDSLVTTYSDTNKFDLFQSSYKWDGDKLVIVGQFGFQDNMEGFNIEIVNNRVKVFYTRSAYFPVFFPQGEETNNTDHLSLASTLNKLVFSEKINHRKRDTIYGYVELTSPDFYMIGETRTFKLKRTFNAYFKSTPE